MDSKFIALSVPNFSGREKELVSGAIVSEWVSTGGSLIVDFENKIADYTGCRRAVAANSGTSGLHLALMAAGVKAGDEVIAPALTFIAAVNPIRYVGAEPVFMGCDDSLCMDPEAVRDFCLNKCKMEKGKLINKKSGKHVSAIMLVHVFGNMADMPAFLSIAEEFGICLIEDATEALGTYYTKGPLKGKMAGTMGDAGVYSFNGNKIITTGAGGMVVSKHGDWLDKVRHLSTQAKADELNFVHDMVGYNYRLTNLQAALGIAQMEQLEGFIRHKHSLYDFYKNKLHGKNGFKILDFNEGIRSNKWFFSLISERENLGRQEIIEKLAANKIQSRPVWALINEQAPYAENEAYCLEKAQWYREKIVNIPCSTNLSMEDAQRVAKVLLEM